MDVPRLITIDGSFNSTPHEGSVSEASWLFCSADDADGVVVITNISGETKKYKEFNENCQLYIAPIRKNNLFYIPADKFFHIICSDSTKITRISATDEKLTNDVEIKKFNISQKLDFEFYNNLVYNGVFDLNYTEIIQNNGLYQIQRMTDETVDRITRELASLSTDNTKTNRFLNIISLNRELTPFICDWMREEIVKNNIKITSMLDPSKLVATISYLEYFINNKVVPTICSHYGISLDQFSIVVYGYIYHQITQNDAILQQQDNNFSLDIALTDVNGYYKFNNGTTYNLKKGDCIIYSNTIQSQNTNIGNDMPRILKTVLSIEPKQPKFKVIY
jgi:hypothetical protein